MSAHARAHKQAFNKSRSVGRGQKKGILVRVAYLMSWVQSAVAVNRAKGGGGAGWSSNQWKWDDGQVVNPLFNI